MWPMHVAAAVLLRRLARCGASMRRLASTDSRLSCSAARPKSFLPTALPIPVSIARERNAPLIKLIGRIHVRRQDQSFQFMSMVTTIDLSAAKAPDLELVGAGLPSPASSFSEPAAGAAMDVRHEDSSPQSSVESAYEQNAVAALLGLHTACVEVSSPDEDSREEDDAAPTGADLGGMGRWGDHDAKRWPHLSGVGYSSPSDGSPKTFRPLDYDTPGQSSPKRQRNPKDGARPPSPSRAIPTGSRPLIPQVRIHVPLAIPSPDRARARLSQRAGAPPPGTSRFRCRFPGCKKLYASTDAVRKHCRKRHLEWLRRIDLVSAHERGLPKPALYCVWGDEEDEM